jgi:hypothetical protein
MSNIKDRFIASLIHLAISCTIAAIAMVVVFYIWYPEPLHTAVGVTQIYLILLGVDITLGPLLTFIVFKKGKKYLKLDLAIIAFLQLAALCYGMNTVFAGRPAFVVFNVDRFDVTRAHEINPASAEKAEKSGNQVAKISLFKPKWVAALAAKDSKRNEEIMFSAVAGGPDWPQLPELYVPLSEVKKQMLEKAKPLAELRKLHNNDPGVIEQLANWKDSSVKWLALRGPVKNQVVLIDSGTADVVQVLDIKPWS